MNDITASSRRRRVKTNSFLGIFAAALVLALPLAVNGEVRVMPTGYRQLESITSTGTQYIKTGMLPTSTTTVEMDFNTGPYANDMTFFGQAWGLGQYLFVKQLNSYRFYGSSGVQVSSLYNDTDAHLSITSEDKFILDYGTSAVTTTVSRACSSSAFNVFADADGSHNGSWTLYSMQISTDGVLVRDFVPALRESDDAVGLYDLAGNSFYANAGTGSFTAGALVSVNVLQVATLPDGCGSPSPSGATDNLAAGATLSVSCGTTPWTNGDGSIQYACTGWKLYDKDNTVVSNGNETSFTYTHPTPAAYRKLEWQWKAIAFRGTIAAGSGGTVSPSGTAMYPFGTEVTVTATPETGGKFICWGGNLPDGVTATSASVTFTPTAPFAMAAIFLSEFYVAPTGSDDNAGSESSPFATISNAIEKADMALASGAVDSATIHVADGTYTEHSLYLTNAITIVGQSGNRDAVVVDAAGTSSNQRRAFYLNHASATISGISVRGGYVAESGGNIYIASAGGTVTNCVLASGTIVPSGSNEQGGGNIALLSSSALVADCVITNGYIASNGAYFVGGNVYMPAGRVTRCFIKGGYVTGGNTSTGNAYLTGSALMDNSIITGGSVNGNGYWCDKVDGVRLDARSRLVNCTVVGNNPTSLTTCGIRIYSGDALAINCIIYGNGGTATAEWFSTNPSCFVNCAVAASAGEGFTGNGCVTNLTDAAFVDYANGDYHPVKEGVLVNAGTKWTDYTGYGATSTTDLAGDPRLSGKFLDIGCYEFSPRTGLLLIVR